MTKTDRVVISVIALVTSTAILYHGEPMWLRAVFYLLDALCGVVMGNVWNWVAKHS